MLEHKILLSQPYNFETGEVDDIDESKEVDARRFYTEEHGFGYVKVHEETDYTSVEEIDNGWLQIVFSENPDLFGGEDGKYNELLELVSENPVAITSLIQDAIERGE